MDVFVLIMSDRDMRPRIDIVTTAIFASHDAAKEAMEHDIAESVVDATDIERSGNDYAVTPDGRFLWKIEKKRVILRIRRPERVSPNAVLKDVGFDPLWRVAI